MPHEVVKLADGNNGIVDRISHPNHIHVITTTEQFCNFKRAVISHGGYSKRRVINDDVMINFNTKIVWWPDGKKKIPLSQLYQRIEFYCDDIIADLFTKNCKNHCGCI